MLASCCKLFAAARVGWVADRTVQIFGGAGYIEVHGGTWRYMEKDGIERFHRDARLFRIYEGTSQIQQTIIAKQMIR